MRSMCESDAGKACEVQVPSLMAITNSNANARPETHQVAGGSFFSEHRSSYFSRVEKSILEDPAASLHCSDDPQMH